MALEAVVYQQQDQFSYGCTKEFYYGTSSCFDSQEDKPLLAICDNNTNVEEVEDMHEDSSVATTTTTTTERRKRRRGKSGKNEKEMENQKKRMTHIQVERNRRKLMNEYLAVLRTLMPPSYVQRGDQASIIGGAINFVKELELVLTFTEAHQRTTQLQQQQQDKKCFDSPPFAKFFDFPQISKYTNNSTPSSSSMEDDRPMLAESAAADIEVTMVERHANLKILVKKQHRQLLKLVTGLQGLRINILHLNVTSFDQLVLYSASVKIEEGCHLNTVDDIAAGINQMIGRIQEESQSHKFELVY